MTNNITEQTFESKNSFHKKDSFEPEKLKLLVSNHNIHEFDIKKKHGNKNNIFKEIEILKEKDSNNIIDYVKVLKISRINTELHRD
jgi:hypothetical protein